MPKKNLVADGLDKYDGDVFFYFGDITRAGYHTISGLYEQKKVKKSKVCLVLVTRGGDADAAYRIARATNHHYDTIELLIPDICKSAGTLLCIGAHKLIFGDRGELGPLDIQLSKPDEMAESMSGLAIIQAINALQNQLLDSFRTYLLDIRLGSRISTKIAAEFSAKLAESLVSPIAARIDPLTLGEHHRAVQIALEYGERLNCMTKSLKSQGALLQLVSRYPSHGFVIDRREARELFNNVEHPGPETTGLNSMARSIVESTEYPEYPQSQVIFDVAKLIPKKKEDGNDEETTISDERGGKEDPHADGVSECESQGDKQNSDGASSPVPQQIKEGGKALSLC